MYERLLPALRDRRARRAFSGEAVSPDEERDLWEAVSVAPSHGNTQATRLLVARKGPTGELVRAALSEGNRPWASKAPLLVAVAVLPSHENVRSYGEDRALWALHAGIALGNLMAQATSMGLIAHPVAGFDEDAVRRAFGAPAELRVLALVAIGQPGDASSLPEDLQARETTERTRMPLDRLVVDRSWSDAHGESARGDRGR